MLPLGTRRVVAEFGIIVAGVLTALAVDSCAQGRREAALEDQYLTRLERDLVANERSLDEAQAFYRQVSDRARAGLLRLQNDSAALDPASTLIVLYHASRGDQPEIIQTTYQELISSGQLRLIRNSELRDRLVQYHLSVQQYLDKFAPWLDRQRFRDRLRRAIPADMQTSIMTACRIEVEDVGACRQVGQPEQTRAVLDALVADPELRSDLNLWVAAQGNISRATEFHARSTRLLLSAVRQELGK